MKKILIPLLLLTFLFAVVDDASAQRRGKKKRRKKEDTEESSTRDKDSEDEAYGGSFMQKLNSEIKLGNLNFFGNRFSLSMKANTGYKFNNTFSAGLGGKFYYDYFSVQGPGDEGFFSYGGLVYGRAKITQQLYIHAEYNALNLAFTLPRTTFNYPSAGLGYMYEGFNWSTGVEVLLPFDDFIRDNLGIVEYWFTFSHNF